jgi:serine/threonine-protein kinase
MVALKVFAEKLCSESVAWGAMLREARLAARLNHPHICTIYEVGEQDGQPYIAMEYVDGLPLRDLLEDGALIHEKTAYYATQIAEALAHAHQNGVIHGDVKSSNVIVAEDGTLKLLDFGMATRFQPEDLRRATSSRLPLAEVGPVGGTLTYLAPEILGGESATIHSDIWSFGVLLYEMMAGRLPFVGQTGFEIATAILTGQRESLPDAVPFEIRTIVDRCLQSDPERRYGSAWALVADLKAAVTATPAKSLAPAVERISRTLLSAVVIALLVLGAVLVVPQLRKANNPDQPLRNSSTTTQEPASPRAITSGNPNVKVWVNRISRIYHCPGSRWYGKTKVGDFVL